MSDIILRGGYDKVEQASVLGGAIAGITAVSSGLMLAQGLTSLSAFNTREGQFVANMYANIVSLTSQLFYYYFGSSAKIKPAAVIAGIPLGTVTELSYGISDRVLKYRARGGIFLAHQEGGDQTLRIVGKAWGPNRYWFLNMLDLLFIYGMSTSYDLFFNNSLSIGSELTSLQGLSTGATPWTQVDLYDLDAGIEEKHLTFPIITRNRAYNNMYIETYEYRESVELGMNVIEYTIFFRKYLPSRSLKFAIVFQESTYRNLKVIHYYKEDEDDLLATKIRRADLMTDLGFSLSILLYRTYIFLTQNSPELNLAMSFGINLNKQERGDYKEETLLALLNENIDDGNDLVNLSTTNKEELFALD